MTGWSTLQGPVVAMAEANIDTDQLIPARFMSQPRKDGYGGFLLHDVRQDKVGHVLNRHRDAQVLVARRNFGSGSSREAAVYALVDFGIRAVFAPSFGDIFAGNAANNGLLAAVLPDDVIETLIAAIGPDSAAATVDLRSLKAVIAGHEVAFDPGPVARTKLINGWDDIDMTAQHDAAIAEFRAAHIAAHPWVLPAN